MSSGRECHLFHIFYQETKTTEALPKTRKETLKLKSSVLLAWFQKTENPEYLSDLGGGMAIKANIYYGLMEYLLSSALHPLPQLKKQFHQTKVTKRLWEPPFSPLSRWTVWFLLLGNHMVEGVEESIICHHNIKLTRAEPPLFRATKTNSWLLNKK